MISLRHHLLTIVSVFLALAVGVVLGGGPLSDVGDRVASDASESTGAEADDPSADFSEDFIAATSQTLLSGRLEGQPVAVLTVPGADEEVVGSLEASVNQAGGRVTGRFALGDAVVDPAQKSLVDTLGAQLVTQQPDGAISESASTYDRFGELLGASIGTRSATGRRFDSRARSVLDSMAGAGLVDVPDAARGQAPVVLLVLGDDGDDAQSDAITSGIVAGLLQQSRGVVVAGSVADGAEGQLARLREDGDVADATTVDGVETAAGQISTVLAVARAHSTRGGEFGAAGAQGPVPLG